ncbi:ADP-ribosylglycohydrolase family protein [Anabaena sp. UHCC 0399]|uniref:ADP-ribosylglycohydrolase family protein n=1 Tax=Anabaena sp. UHCC 0399 TaxID=3110238 RepID=UPI002B1E93B4|nr:ADP-ribosylglycohydrolase family protein [Anabaena sp. UHCC 0399]MEA5567304.1 ADP-ribosylglycohydrolase family protein [Anabaena sp. UHCC 0399]
MRYLLGSRFRGVFLGGLVGEALAQSSQLKHPIGGDFAQSVVPGATSLIKLGKFDIDDWLEIYQQKFTHLEPSKIIFATIPISVFFHENPVKLHQNLLRLLKNWDSNLEIRDSTLAIGYAIAQSLTEKLHPQTLIPQIIAFIGETNTSLPQNLLKVNNLLERRAGLERVQTELDSQGTFSNGIALAFYYFLSTLEDFPLAVLRSIRHDEIWQKHSGNLYFPNTSVITGLLSGVYNSNTSIPVNWRVSLTRQLSQISQVLELADALATTWSGVYEPGVNSQEFAHEESLMSNENIPPCVYAAPRVIRAR